MPRRGSPYGPAYERERRAILHGNPPCWRGCGRPATTGDHQPPLTLHEHVEPWPSSGCCRLLPACAECQAEQAVHLLRGEDVPEPPPAPAPAPERAPCPPPTDPVWDRPWIRGFRKVPKDATWPRYMTVPHPLATGSYGEEFTRWSARRSKRRLRWWQRLASVRLLEHDADGNLVWETLLLSLARQLGKSWWLRDLILWRMEQGARFGEPQDVVHTGKDLAICKEVQRPARIWAKQRPGLYRVREVNGQEEIERLEDGSRWLLRAKEAVYGYSASLAAVDEAWKVPASSVEEGLTPTMAEREQSQLVLVSTAHRLATVLMLGRRTTALTQMMDPPAAGADLIIEWSAPRDAPIDSPDTWRLASPHWTDKRERLVAKRLAAALNGESDDPDEPDPMESFIAQWLNIWPLRRTIVAKGDELVDQDAWAELAGVKVITVGPLSVAVEDDAGKGAAVAAAARTRDGRYEVDGWTKATWNEALEDAKALLSTRPRSRLLLGPAVMAKAPKVRPAPTKATAADTRGGLSLLRDLVSSREVVHDDTPELDEQLSTVRVKEMASGLVIVPGAPAHLVRAAVWALRDAQSRRRVPRVHAGR